MTVKLRLALLFTLVVALILAIFTVALYEYVLFNRSSNFDKVLLGHAIAAGTVTLDSDELSADRIEPFRRTLQDRLPYERIAVYDTTLKNYFNGGSTLPSIKPSEWREAVRLGSFSSAVGDTQRAFYQEEDDGRQYVIAVSALDVNGIQSVGQLAFWLIGAYAVAIGVVFGAGWWFASRAMAPISMITARAESISATDLHIRIDEGNRVDELAKLARAFNGMLDRIQSAFHSQRQFIANASHELRTPLTGIEGQLEIALLQDRSGPDYRYILQSTLDDARRLRALTNDLLLLAQANSGFTTTRRNPCRFDEILFQALEGLHQRYSARKIDVAYAGNTEEETLLVVNANADLLRTAIQNLIENALKYSGETDPARVTLKISSTHLTLSVQDLGPGIPADEIGRIFEPFYRSEGTKQVHGTGIGLALVQSIAEFHNGSVRVAATSSMGTTMEMRLPVHPTALAQN